MVSLLSGLKSVFTAEPEDPEARFYPPDPEKLDRIARQNWKVPVRALEGVEHMNLPYTIRPSLYLPIRNMFLAQDISRREANRLAYKAYLLFESADNVRYFQRSQEQLMGTKHALPDLMRMIVFPPSSTWQDVEFRSWGRAFVQHSIDRVNMSFHKIGPYMKPVKRGQRVSLAATQFTYAAQTVENPALAQRLERLFTIAESFGKNDRELERAWNAYVGKGVEMPVPEEQQLPDIVINGAAFGMDGTVFRRLEKDDPRILFVGDYTHCCERVTDQKNNLERNVVAAIHADDCGYYVVERGDEIIAHSLAYRGTSKELVFDGFESNHREFNRHDYENLAHAIGNYIAQENPLGIYKALVGECAEHLRSADLEAYPGVISLVKPRMMHNKVGIVQARLQVIA